ncbi:MAG: Smr/MutS family protein, partial [Bacteroidetes bacterium]|nr:Smr/MutS family protein [Bacteroidota bacterium]
PVKDIALICPYCAQPLSVLPKKAIVVRKVLILNLEAGKPFVKEALEKFENELKMARAKKVGLIKIIHGYGSSGTGGKIKEALHIHLISMLNNNTIKGFIAGEHYSKLTKASSSNQKLVDCYPELMETQHSDCYNPGISFVEL